ncbi:fatty-acyl-CoA synthase [Haloechinothrix alba]|uniref:Fatty-acyl-CoA synthase n=1 Tax=Haloechinothrix alba TaxID=664784 RepID=A0A238XPW0_9PSEU|nr:acyl-CoA synthetase [Haloechinothrix alba]SNR60722.1 fatty-acyl-CoA synthase [Haloechinothrix alba]
MYPGTHAHRTPDKPAVVMAETGEQLSYRVLDENSARLARVLNDAGLRRGDVVAMLSENRLECFEAYWAALRSGLYINAINTHLGVEEIAHIVNDSGARALVTTAKQAEVAEALVAHTSGVANRYAIDGHLTGHRDYGTALAEAGPRLTHEPRGATMLYSSGTTGEPKGIKTALPDASVSDPGEPITHLLQRMYELTAADVYLSPAPIYHAAPLNWCGALHALGATVVMMKRFDAEGALRAIEHFGITVTQVVPTMFVRMLKLPEKTREAYDMSSLRVAVHAAAPCPTDVKRAMIDWWGPILHEYYGSTEGNGITFIDTEQWLRKPGSVGRAALGTARICDDDGAELGAGEVGLVYFERDHLPFEYHNDPEKTKIAQHPQHPTWTTVGDVGYLDEDGFLYLTDRKSFMIISGGVNIYPQEIESVLTLHPAVDDVAVIGVPDTDMGEQVKAVIKPAHELEASNQLGEELIEYVRSRLAHYKAPRSVDFVTTLPRTATGKLRKGELRDQYVDQ